MADIKIIVDSSDVATATNRVDQLGSSGTVAQKGIDKAARGMNQFGTVAKNGGKKLNTFNMQIQQGGYQLQDFVVQLQSGTSFFTAFGQQGSQFAGVFGPQGAVIGAIIAIGSAVGGMGYKMLTASEDVKTLQEKIEDLETATSDYADALSGLTMPVDAFGNVIDQVAGKVSALSQAMLEIKQIKFEESLKAVTNLLPAFESSPLGRGMTGMEAKNIFDLFPEIKQTQSAGPATVTAAKFGTLIGKAMEAKGLEEQAAAFEAIRQSVVELAGPFETMNEKQRQFYESVIAAQNQIQQVIEANEAANAKIEDEKQRKLDKLNKGRFAAIMAQYAAGKKQDDQANKAKQTAFDAEARRIDQRFKSEADIFSMQVRVSRENEQRNNAIAETERRRIDNRYQAEAELFNQSVTISSETQALIDKRIASEERAIDQRFKGEADLFDQAVAMSDATLAKIEEDAKKAAKAYSTAFESASFLFRQRFQGEAAVMGQSFTPSGKIGMSYEELLAAGVPHDNIVAMGIKAPRAKKAKKTDLEKLRERLTLEEALIGKTETQKVLLQELGVNYEKIYGSDSIGKLETRIEKLRQIAEEEARVADLANTIGSAMEDSLMSMVDGTKSVKDAFRDMAADIVRHLYKVLVVQQMINAFGGMMSGSSNASIAKIGGALESYDNGGYTGNGPRSGGLDGKGGFMAIMHPRETVVDHTKGQQASTNGPTIVQNFNFSANGDDSVKKIIAQAAPQIAQMTKNSMLNDRRRGGTTKAVFG